MSQNTRWKHRESATGSMHFLCKLSWLSSKKTHLCRTLAVTLSLSGQKRSLLKMPVAYRRRTSTPSLRFALTYRCVSAFFRQWVPKNSYYSSLISEHSHQCLLLDITQFESKKGVVTSSSIKTEMLLQNNVLTRNWFSLYSLTYSYHHHHYIWSTFTTSVMCWKFGFRPLILWVGVRNFSLKMSNFQLTRYRTAKVNKKTADCDK